MPTIELNNTQREIYNYMETYGGITQAEAFTQLGVGRLGARIWDMINKKNVPIKSETIKVRKRDGSYAYVARYSIVKEDLNG